MKYRFLFCLLVISILACSVTSADNVKQEKSNLDQIEEKCMGKTKAEVVKVLGQPDIVPDNKREFWEYTQGFKDSITGKTYKKMQLFFLRGEKVHWIKWFGDQNEPEKDNEEKNEGRNLMHQRKQSAG